MYDETKWKVTFSSPMTSHSIALNYNICHGRRLTWNFIIRRASVQSRFSNLLCLPTMSSIECRRKFGSELVFVLCTDGTGKMDGSPEIQNSPNNSLLLVSAQCSFLFSLPSFFGWMVFATVFSMPMTTCMTEQWLKLNVQSARHYRKQ